MSNQYPVIDPKDLIGGDDDKPVKHKQNRMSEQQINAFALLIAAIVNQKEINLHELLEDYEYYKDIICGDIEDNEESPT